MRLVALLLCSSVAFGQSTASSPEPKAQTGASSADQKNQNKDFGLGIGARGNHDGNVDILSDTKGVDFRPYLKVVLQDVRENWYHLIPECAQMMKGKLAIEFAIAKDGKIADMKLVSRSHAILLDRAAWGSITASNPFRPLPGEFTGSYLALRFRFYYNPNSNGPDSSGDGCSGDVPRISSAASHPKTTSGIAVSITKPVPGQTDVPLGGSTSVVAIVTGTGTKESTVEWSITGLGCSGTSCGELIKDSYHAPGVMPTSPFVVLTAVARADPTAKASITIHIVQPSQ
jgi:hypothetical protein